MLAGLAFPAPLLAQRSVALPSLGSVEEDRARVRQLAGDSTAGSLLRIGGALNRAPLGVRLVRPELRLTHQSQLPAPDNDGALSSARGANVLLRTGLTVARGRFQLILAPELAYSANRPFEVRASTAPDRSAFASPWRASNAPADLPTRFGDQPLAALLPGQSSASLQFSSVTVGMMSGNLWWGPALRNALVLSDHAPGIPRLSLRTTTPKRTPLGEVEAEWFAGALTESPYFDNNVANDLRSISAFALTLAPRGVPGLSLGAGRIVLAQTTSGAAIAGRAADALTTWSGDADRDQMATAFFRWVAPDAGVELWGEYAKQRLPATPREALTEPNADMGWTAGAQWALPRRDGVWRLQLEFSDVAQSTVRPSRPPRDWGTGSRVPHGFTQRGQLLGPATGPGSTHAWFAVDRMRTAWSVGGFAARTRWENDAFYRQGIVNFFAHDVSLIGGLRAQWRLPHIDLATSAGWERRFNYQFENGTINPNNRGQRNYDNLRLTLALTPR